VKFTNIADQVDVVATAKGGGVGGQAGAVRMGLSRAIFQVQSGIAAVVAQERIFDARFAYEGTQEVRTEGREKRFQFTKR